MLIFRIYATTTVSIYGTHVIEIMFKALTQCKLHRWLMTAHYETEVNDTNPNREENQHS